MIMNTVMDPKTMLGLSYPGMAIILVLVLLVAQYYNGLSHIPGPRSAKFSNFWKIHAAWKGEMPKRNIALHRKYGPLVRMGPNMISVDDPAALSVIYSFKPIWKKVRLASSLSLLDKTLMLRSLHFTQSSRHCTMGSRSRLCSPPGTSSTTHNF